jgi:cytochrome c oxidase cbb3-type subunit III
MTCPRLCPQFRRVFASIAGVLALAGCGNLAGRPGPGPKVINPAELLDFNTLFRQNCSGCHGAEGKGGAAIALRDPIFLAIVPDAALRSIAAKGVPGTQMSAFAQGEGGILTDEQIDVLVRGIRSWAQTGALSAENLPPYQEQSPGDAQRGEGVYATYCSSCHGPDGQGGKKAGSIVNATYLALVSDQYLRTVVIAGRPELGNPDWRNDVPGHPMSAQDISDVVAWLVAQRQQFPGQPYPASKALTR